MGWVYYKKGLFDSAIAEFSGGLEKGLDNAAIHCHLGLAYLKKDARDKAREEFEKALVQDPNSAHAAKARDMLSGL